MRKEFTVGDMIRALEKLDPDLPIYDQHCDDETLEEVWFNRDKPKPKTQTIYLKGSLEGDTVTLAWTDQRVGGKTIEKKKIVILYPQEKGVTEL